ncbi:hemopexin [Eudromia elegans]
MRCPTVRCPTAALGLAWALALACAGPLSRENHGTFGAGPPHGTEPPSNDTELLELCGAEDGDGTEDVGFDAATLSENGTLLLFRGADVWEVSRGAVRRQAQSALWVRMGLQALWVQWVQWVLWVTVARCADVWEVSRGAVRRQAQSALWPELGGPVEAALRVQRPQEGGSLYLFQGEQVWAYAGGRLRAGFPRRIGDEFPGVPGGLDAAVECHAEECGGESVLFLKGDTVFSFDAALRVAKVRAWPLLPCGAALRWLGRHYCLRGRSFRRFAPGAAGPAGPPRDLRDYFLPCPGRGHGPPGNSSQAAVSDRCSRLPFDAFASDDDGRVFAFRDGLYWRLDSHRDGWHPWPLAHAWPELSGPVDAAFSWENKMYLIQGSQVSIYVSGRGFRRVQGYPRALHEELGVRRADAAFTCPRSDKLYVLAGSSLRLVELAATPRRAGPALPLALPGLDGALCTARGLFLFRGPLYYRYGSVAELAAGAAPAPRNVSTDFFHCAP